MQVARASLIVSTMVLTVVGLDAGQHPPPLSDLTSHSRQGTDRERLGFGLSKPPGTWCGVRYRYYIIVQRLPDMSDSCSGPANLLL